MSRLAPLGFVGILACCALVAYRVAEPRQIVTEANNRDILSGMATGQALQLTAMAPTATRYATITPTRTPKPPTETPRPTYGASVEPGVFVVPAYTPTPMMASTQEPDALPSCDTVTPRAYADQLCEVK